MKFLYYRDLDFIDIEDSIDSYKRKRTISRAVADESNGFSRVYIDKKGKLRRIDRLGSGLMPSETYILYKDNLPVKAFKFWLGLSYHGGKVSSGGELAETWTYLYDDGILIELVCHTYPDLDFTYRLVSEKYRHVEYEYDEEGLVRTYQWVHGLNLYGKKISHIKTLIYDRKRNEILRNYTISKKALVPSARGKRHIASFEFGGHAPSETICQKCSRPMDYLGSIRLESPLKNQSLLSVVSIFFCFNCLESNSYRLEWEIKQRDLAHTEGLSSFPEEKIPLFRSSDAVEEPNVLVKLGGLPDWIQNDEHPSCPECNDMMMFVCQLNSDDRLTSGRNVLMFGDNGKLFTFICCQTVTNIMQCY